jgi:hypothetical protein
MYEWRKSAREIDLASAVWFWEQIGVDRDALKDILPELRKSYDEAEQRVRVASQESAKGIVNVPILRGIGSAKEPLVAGPEQIEGWFPLPAALVPNPSRTSCIRAPKGMSALFGDDLVIVDATPLPLDELWGRMVIAIRHSTGTAYAGFLQKLQLDNRQIRALSQLRLNEDYDLKHTTQITDRTNLSSPPTESKVNGQPDRSPPVTWNSANHDAEFRLGFVRTRDLLDQLQGPGRA